MGFNLINMPDVHFYLKSAEKKSGLHLVLLQMRYQGHKFVYSCKFNVAKSEWSSKKERLRSNATTDETGEINYNKRLDNLKRECAAAYIKEMEAGTPTNATLKRHLDNYLAADGSESKGPSFYNLIDRFISGEIGEKTAGTLKTYQTAKKHLVGFEHACKYKLTFDTINLDFKYAYVKYLAKDKKEGKRIIKGLSPNSIYKEIKNVRTFMNEAIELGYTSNLAHKKKAFSVKEHGTDGVYLRESELQHLLNFDLKGNDRLEKVRDFFIFNANIGLRFSDANNLPKDALVEDDGDFYIKTTTGKTKKDVTIYCNETVMQIIKKYNGFPVAPSNQKYNPYIREACEKAGLTSKGRLNSDPTRRLCDEVKSHTARRSYITNLTQRGIDPLTIRKSTGHANSKEYDKYIKESNDDAAKRMGRDLKNNLKAV